MLPAVLSVRKGGPVGKGGQNSDEALVASRSLSGHAPPDPTAQMGNRRRPTQSRHVPTNDTNRVNLCAGQTPGQTPNLIFTDLRDSLAAIGLQAPAPEELRSC
jgi:hypothetical protein